MAIATAHCEPEPAAPVAAPVRARTARVVLLGNPNTGKTTIFNRLCGTRAKTSNFPGTTTSARVGRAALGEQTIAEVLDLPGLYQLSLDVPEAGIARDVLSGAGAYTRPDAVLLVVDACNLTRNLMLAGELIAYCVPMVVALNMVDLAQRRGLTLDADGNVCSATAGIAGFTGLTNPLDLTEDVRTGCVYVAEYGARRITLLRPVEAPTVAGR